MDPKTVAPQEKVRPENRKTDISESVIVHPHRNGTNGSAPAIELDPSIPERLLPDLPTFPLEDGWRIVYDEETGSTYNIPLTLSDILFPTDDDVGAVYMTQSTTHGWLINLICGLLDLYLRPLGWYFPDDVLIYWADPTVPPKGPDIAAIPDMETLPPEGTNSFRVGRDGPMPEAVIEVTSASTRSEDFGDKLTTYAAAGIGEYLIVDIWNDRTIPWELHGYRLGNSPYYEEIVPDADGGVTLQSLGLRFVTSGRSSIQIFDSATGERLRSAEEYRALAEEEAARAATEAARAAAEAARADEAEAQALAKDTTIEELLKRVHALEAGKKTEE